MCNGERQRSLGFAPLFNAEWWCGWMERKENITQSNYGIARSLIHCDSTESDTTIHAVYDVQLYISVLVSGCFGIQLLRGEKFALPELAVHLFTPSCRVICRPPCGFVHPEEATKTARYSRHVFHVQHMPQLTKSTNLDMLGWGIP